MLVVGRLRASFKKFLIDCFAEIFRVVNVLPQGSKSRRKICFMPQMEREPLTIDAPQTAELIRAPDICKAAAAYSGLYLKVLLVFLASLLAGCAAVYWLDRAEIAQHKRVAVEAASVHGHLLQEQLGRSLSATYALAAVLRQGQGEIDDFDALAGEMLAMYGGVSALQLAPSGVIRRIVPLAGHESALGHKLLDDPERNKEAFLALKSRTLTLAGPFVLRQGGEAVVGRLPVFLQVGEKDEQFWGFVTAVIRIPDLLRAGGLSGTDVQGHEFALARLHPDRGTEQMIWRSVEAPLLDPVVFPIQVPNGQWTLSVSRTGGWHTATLTLGLALFAVLLISGLSAFLAYHLLRQPILLSEQIAARTAALNQANESLQSEIFQHWETELALREGERQLEHRVQERTQALEMANASLQREQAQQKVLIDKLADTRSQLLHSEMMAAVGQLAAGVAHEINNPLGFISSNVGTLKGYFESLMDALERHGQLLAPYLEENPFLKEQLLLLEQEIELSYIAEDIPSLLQDTLDGLLRVKRIVQDLREFSLVDQAAWQEVDLNRSLQSTLGVMANEFGAQVRIVHEQGKLALVEANAPQINQVFRNLLLNAVQAIDGAGEIRVVTRQLEEGWVELEIADTGHGIAPENLDRVFEPFFTTRSVGQGMGLGLSVAYHLVKRHGGSIAVQSSVGNGAVFVVRLPETQAQAAEQQ